MEEAVFGLGCLLGGLTLVAMVLAVAAFGRSGEAFRLKKRVDALDAEVMRLRIQLTGLAGTARTPGAPAAGESAAARAAAPPAAATSRRATAATAASGPPIGR